MGLFKRKKKQPEVDREEYKWLTVDEALALSRGEKVINENTIIRMTDDLIEQKRNVERLYSETRFEYEAVIKHLADLQRLGSLSERERSNVMDTARTIVNLEIQRESYQKGERKISSERYHAMEMYADEIPGQLRTMEERERYLMLVNNDMRQLEGEKGSIKYEKEQAAAKKVFLTKFTYAAIIIVLTLFIVFFVLADRTGKSMTICFLVTGAIASIYAAYYAITIKKCSDEMRKSDLMLNRAVELSNKVKIKYVNTTNALDYSYEKYKCNSHQELAYIWEQYVLEKEEEKKYLKNSQLLTAYQDSLQEQLEGYGFELPDVWIHQAETLLNSGELADLKDVLESRRRKLKAQLDYSVRQKENIMSELGSMKAKYPKYDGLLQRIIDSAGA